jgi:fatty acid desaturase
MCFNFMINGFHELVHLSVFKRKSTNRFFLRIFSFLGWYNHHFFWASHTEHHKYTLHPPDDLEVELPMELSLKGFFKAAVVNPWGFWWTVKNHVRVARGRINGAWEEHLFPEEEPDARRALRNWARFVLVGHALILGVSIATGYWYVGVAVSLAPFYGGWLHYLCNSSQHVGLQDNIADFRLCCRTIYLNPFVQFLYWHMNYHTEHHMYAAVPCYKLGKLHRIIKDDMPECPRGLWATWRQIIGILRRQKREPGYMFIPELPTPSPAVRTPWVEPDAEGVTPPSSDDAIPTSTTPGPDGSVNGPEGGGSTDRGVTRLAG